MFPKSTTINDFSHPVQWSCKVHPCSRIGLLHDALAECGADPSAVLAATGLSLAEARSPETRVSLNQILAAYGATSRLSPDPMFAFRCGMRSRVSYFGMYGFALMSAPDMRTMLHFAIAAQSLSASLCHASAERCGDQVAIVFDPFAHRDIDTALYRFLVEEQFGIVQNIFRDLTGADFRLAALKVTYAPTTSLSQVAGLLEAEAFFAQKENVLAFDASWLEAKLQFGHLIAHASVRKTCNALLGELKQQAGIAGQVGEALIANYGRILDIEEVAERLGLSARVLRRKLDAENTGYRQICDDVRSQVAMKYLRDTRLAIEHIASAIGFDNAANFRRAFRRWTGVTPSEYRQTAMAG